MLAHTRAGGINVADVVGFATLPRLYAGLLVGLGGVLAASSLVKRLREARGHSAVHRIRSPLADATVLVRTFGSIVLLVLYVLGLQQFSFFPVTAIFLAVMFFLYGRGPIWRVLLVAVIGAAALDVVRIQPASGHLAPLADVAIPLEHLLTKNGVDPATLHRQRLADLGAGGGLGGGG